MGAQRRLIAAAAAGTTKLRRKLAEATALAKLHGPEAVDEALQVAADAGRFGDGDLAAILGDLLGLTIAVVVGVARFPSAHKLVGYSGLTPRITQSGERSHTGKLSKAGSKLLRWAAIEAVQQAWRPSRRGGQRTLGTRSTATSRRAAPARATRPSPPSRARC
jgi:transposase